MKGLAVIFMTFIASSVTQDCQDRFLVCLESLISTSSSHPTNNTLLCRDMNDFFRCYTSTCPASDFDLNNIRRDLANHGFTCDVSSLRQPSVSPQSSYGAITTPAPRSPTNNITVPCQSAVETCTKDYMDAIVNTTKNQQVESVTVCSFSYDYIKCLTRLCDTDEVINKLKQGFESELRQRGVTCYLTIEEIIPDDLTIEEIIPDATFPNREVLFGGDDETNMREWDGNASGGHLIKSSTVWTLSLLIYLLLVIFNNLF